MPDSNFSVIPTMEWQNSLSDRVAAAATASAVGHVYGFASNPTFDSSGVPFPRSRRLDPSNDLDCAHLNWNEMYTMDGFSGDGRFTL